MKLAVGAQQNSGRTSAITLWRWRLLFWSVIVALVLNVLPAHTAQAATPAQCSGASCDTAPTGLQASMIKAPYQTKALLYGAQKVQFAAPALADLDHDRYLEIIVGTSDGWVYAIKPDSASGTVLWSFDTAAALDAVAEVASPTTVRAAPTIADLDNDGWNEIIIAVGTIAQSQQNGGLLVLDHNGNLLPGWPQLTLAKENPPFTSGMANSPAVADLDSDGDKEIVIGAFDQRMYAFHHDGAWVTGWPLLVHETVWTSPAIGDLDNDGFPEIVVGIDSHNNPYFGTIDGGALYVLRTDGTVQSGFPIYINEAFASSPALADLNGDGHLEIVIGGGTYYDHSDGYKVHAYDWTGKVLSHTWPVTTGGHVSGSPAIADLDHDGALEVIVGSDDRKVYAWRSDGTAVAGFPKLAAQYTGAGAEQRTPVVANRNGATATDGKLEIFVSNSWEITVLDATGSQLTWDGTPGNARNLPTYWADWTLDASPAVADVDGDGRLELVAAGSNSADNGTVATVYVWELADSRANEGLSDWPMFKHDVARSGRQAQALAYDSVIVRHTIPANLFSGSSQAVDLVLRNTGTASWNLPVFQISPRLAQAPTANGVDAVVAPGQEVTLTAIMTAPSGESYFNFIWRTGDANTGPFGQALYHSTKVGNVPAGYVLRGATAANGGGVYPLANSAAQSLTPPNDEMFWERLTDFHLSRNNLGYFVVDRTGFIQWGGDAPDLGSVSATGPAVALALTPDRQSYYVMNSKGMLWASGAAMPINPLPPIYSDGRMRDLVVTTDSRGAYVVDMYGNVYRGGTAPLLSPATPVFGSDNVLKIKLTKNNTGYYVLDRSGKVWNGGTAPALAANYSLHPGEDWARDFELTADETGYYLLTKYGELLAGGTALGLPASSQFYWADGSATDLELGDTGRALNPPLSAAVSSINKTVALGAAALVVPVNLTAADGTVVLLWSASLAPAATWVRLSASSGATPKQLQVTLNPQGLKVGTYTTNLSFSATGPDGLAVQTPSIPITLKVVANLNATFVPMVSR